MVEKETALAKAVSITKRHEKEKSSPPNKMTGHQTIHFFFARWARIFNHTHSMQVKTGTPSEVPICCSTRQATSSPTDQAKNHSSTSHDCPHHHQSKNPNREGIRGATRPTPDLDSAPKSGDISRHGYHKTRQPALVLQPLLLVPVVLTMQNDL